MKVNLDSFDNELADETFRHYHNCNQTNKNQFINCFDRIFRIDSKDKDELGKTVEGLNKLKNKLMDLGKEYKNNNKSIAAISTEEFIARIDKLIKSCSETIDN